MGRCAGAVLGLSLLLAAAASGDTFQKQERFPLSPGSRLKVEMGVGELRIVGGRESSLRVQVTARAGWGSPAQFERQLEIRFRPGKEASLEIRVAEGFTSFNNVHLSAEVTVPSETHLNAELGVGQMRVQGVEGDLRAHVGVGELRLEVSDPALYRSVRAHAGIGDVRHPFGGERSRRAEAAGWLGRTFEGSFAQGRYRIDAEVGVGDVRISEARVI